MTVEQIPGGEQMSEETVSEEVTTDEAVIDEAAEDAAADSVDDVESAVDEVASVDEPGLSRARREAAGYRTKLRAAETVNASLRDQLIGIHLASAGGVTIKALEASGIDLNTLVGEDGIVSVEAVNEAAATARESLGIPNNRFQGTLDQGYKRPPAVQPSWGNLITK